MLTLVLFVPAVIQDFCPTTCTFSNAFCMLGNLIYFRFPQSKPNAVDNNYARSRTGGPVLKHKIERNKKSREWGWSGNGTNKTMCSVPTAGLILQLQKQTGR